jgi:hypothetical protein
MKGVGILAVTVLSRRQDRGTSRRLIEENRMSGGLLDRLRAPGRLS